MNTRVDAIYWQRCPYLCPQFGDLSADRGWQGLFGLRRHRKTNVVAKPAAALILWSQLRLFLCKSNINKCSCGRSKSKEPIGAMVLESSLKQTVRTLCTEALVATGIIDRIFGRKAFSAYDYMFTPRQLIYFTQCLSETRDVPGCCVEVGCAYGQTTAFLRKFMDESRIVKDYYAIDTFRGFVPGHVDYEVERRSKNRRAIATSFVTNKKKWFDNSLKAAGIHSVSSVACDATKFDFDHIGPIAFALLDVDLYVPMIDILPKVYQNLSTGGILLIDDCKPDERWDGALAAYEEFASRMGFEPQIVFDKIGVVPKR